MALTLYEHYDRQAVHDIFDSNSKFTAGAGCWGLQGIVPLKGTEGDYIFFVSFGRSQGDHTFEEEIFDDGTITWQSQPSNKLTHKYVQHFINHDASLNTIYLFLRTSTRGIYTYMGPLEYVSHDNERECPVYFMWRMIDFDIAKAMKALPELTITSRTTGAVLTQSHISGTQSVTGAITLKPSISRRNRTNRKGVTTGDFTGRNIDHQGEAAKNSATGKAGEDAVVNYEKDRLTSAGHPELADKVVATRDTIGNTAKFDVLSYEEDGTERYIEVKTTTGVADNDIHISEGEVWFSEQHADQYYLYRVYNFDRITGTGDFYITKGAIDRGDLVPTNYRF